MSSFSPSNPWKSKMMSLMSDHKFLLTHCWRLLVWEKPFFPVITFLGLTIFFWIIAMFKASVITTLAVVGILITFIDFIGPSMYPQLVQQFGPERDSEYEAACGFLAAPFVMCEKGIERLTELKRRQKAILSGSVAGALLVGSLVGRVNNYYLCYLGFLVYLMAPGAMKRAGIQGGESSSSSSSGSGSSWGTSGTTGTSSGFGSGSTGGIGRTSSNEGFGTSSFSPSTSSTPKPSTPTTTGFGSSSGSDSVTKVKSKDDDDD